MLAYYAQPTHSLTRMRRIVPMGLRGVRCRAATAVLATGTAVTAAGAAAARAARLVAPVPSRRLRTPYPNGSIVRGGR